jgi:hypothetical protein
MLRDRHYLGVVTFRGAEYQGRHESLISHGLFEQVQDIIEGRAAAMERGALEEAVEEHYATIRFRPAAARPTHRRVETLDSKEENLLDLAADEEMPKARITSRLRDIERRRQHLTERLGQTTDDLVEVARFIDGALTVLEIRKHCPCDATTISGACSTRRSSIRSTEEEIITGYELKGAVARLHALHAGRRSPLLSLARPSPTTKARRRHKRLPTPERNRTLPLSGKDPLDTLNVLLGAPVRLRVLVGLPWPP